MEFPKSVGLRDHVTGKVATYVAANGADRAGNAHAVLADVEDAVKVLSGGTDQAYSLVEVNAPAVIVHAEHGPAIMTEGLVSVTRQEEVNSLGEFELVRD